MIILAAAIAWFLYIASFIANIIIQINVGIANPWNLIWSIPVGILAEATFFAILVGLLAAVGVKTFKRWQIVVPDLFIKKNGYYIPASPPKTWWVFKEKALVHRLDGPCDDVIKYDGKRWFWYKDNLVTTDWIPFTLSLWDRMRGKKPEYYYRFRDFESTAPYRTNKKTSYIMDYYQEDYYSKWGPCHLTDINELNQLGQIQALDLHTTDLKTGHDVVKTTIQHLPFDGILFVSMDGNKLAKVMKDGFNYETEKHEALQVWAARNHDG